MKRVLHVIDTTGPGGAETVFVGLADRLRSHDFDSVAVLRGPGWVMDALTERGVRTIVLDAKGSFNWRYLRALCNLIRREKIDVVQSHLLGSNIYCAVAGWLTRRPVVATFHGAVDINPNERFRRLKFWLMNRGVSRYVAVSRNLSGIIGASGVSAHKKAAVIYNGIDVARYRRPRHRNLAAELGLPADAILVGSLGNVRPAKAYDVLIRTAGELCQKCPRIHFAIAGHIKERAIQPLQALLRELSLSDRIHFLGFRPDTVEFLSGLDLFVLSSRSEGFSIATIEAQATGLPVIATRCGGPEEIISDHDTGLLVPINDPGALARAIAEVLENKGLAHQLAKAGQEAVRQRFSIDIMIGRYATIYQELCS